MRLLLTSATTALAALLSVSALTAAAAKPSFTGSWKLDASKSEFGQFPAPSSMSMKIAHEDPEMKVTSSMSSDRGDFSWDARYSTDGKETENQMGPNTSKSVAKWDGVTLTISTKAKFGDNDVTIDDRWTMAEDGKSYTIERKWSSAMGETTQKMVMAKQ